MGTKTSTWVGGAVIVAIVAAVASWFLLISPIMASAATASSDAEAAETHNLALTSQLTVLKKQFARLDESKAELAKLQKEMPETADLDGYFRALDAYAERAGVAIVEETPGTPVAVVPQVPEEVQQQLDDAKAAATGESDGEPAPTASSTAAAGDDKNTPASAAVPTLPKQFEPIEGFVAVPIDITVVAGAEKTFVFLQQLQNGARPLLVTAFQAVGQGDQEAQNGRPATHEGDSETKISGYIYVLQDTTPATETDDEAQPEKPATLPKPSGSKDPYASS